MLAWLASLGIGSIAKQLVAAYAQKADAKTEQERIAADERIRTLEARANAQRPMDAVMRMVFAIPVAAYYGKIFLIDKVFGLGVTDGLSPELTTISLSILGFYFLHSLVR